MKESTKFNFFLSFNVLKETKYLYILNNHLGLERRKILGRPKKMQNPEHFGFRAEKEIIHKAFLCSETKEELEELEGKLEAIERQLEKEKQKIPQDYVDYYKKKSSEWSEERKEKWIRNSADNLDMGENEFRDKMLEKLEGDNFE